MSESRPSMPPQAVWRLGFLLVVAWIIALSWFPFEISPDDLAERFRAAFDFHDPGGIPVALIHFVGFGVAGFVGFRAYRNSKLFRSKWIIVAVVVAMCAILEMSKLWFQLRHALVLDLVVKTAGALAGVWFSARRERSVGRPGAERAVLFATSFAGLSLAAWFYVGLKPLGGGLALDWNPAFHLMLGNEGDGTRPWIGEVRQLAVFDRAMEPDEIHALFRDEDPGELARYDFSVGTAPVSGSLTDASLTLQPMANGGMKTLKPAVALTKAINRSGAFSVAVKFQIADLEQTGPARIVSVSKDQVARNFTLGQDRDELVFRVANGLNSPNGNVFELRQKALTKGIHEVVVNHDHGHSEMYVDGVRLPVAVDLREPWYYLPIDKGLAGRAAMLAMFSISFTVPAWFAVRILLPRVGGNPCMLAPLWLSGVLPYTICWMAGGPWNPDLYVGMLAVTFFVAVPSMGYIRQGSVGGDLPDANVVGK